MRAVVTDPTNRPFRNRIYNPAFRTGVTGWTIGSPGSLTVVYTRPTTGGPDGGPYLRWGLSVDANMTNTPWATANFNTVPGDSIYTSVWVRTSWATKVEINLYPMFNSTTETFVGTITTVPNVWMRMSGGPVPASVTAPVSTQFRVRPCVTSRGGSPMLANATVDVAYAMASEDPSMVYADGNTPGWKWAGTPDNSESIGYSYTLESIAGRPTTCYDARYLNGKGVAQPAEGSAVTTWKDLSGYGRDLSQSVPVKRPIYQGTSGVWFDGLDDDLRSAAGAYPDAPNITNYVVFRHSGTAPSAGVSHLHTIYNEQVSPKYRTVELTTGSGSGVAAYTGDVVTTDSSSNTSMSNPAPTGLHVLTASYSPILIHRIRLDGAALGTGGTSPEYNYVPGPYSIFIGNPTPMSGHILFIASYREIHNDATKNKIEKWLGAQFAITVA